MPSKIALMIFFVALGQAQSTEKNRSAVSFSKTDDHHFKIYHNKHLITKSNGDSRADSSITQSVTVFPTTVPAKNQLSAVQILSTPFPPVYGAVQAHQPVVEIPAAKSLLKLSSSPSTDYNSVYKYSTPQQYGYQEEELYGPVKYEFGYAVEDHITGDIHSHKESRDGDLTQGEYSLHDPDGTIRTVKYTAEKDEGFHAIVERTGTANHPVQFYHY